MDSCCYCGKDFYHQESRGWSMCDDCYEKHEYSEREDD